MSDDLVKRLRVFATGPSHEDVPADIRPDLHEAADRIEQQAAEIARLRTGRDEARRRRDEWRKKAEGYDEIRIALREKVGAHWPPNLSRIMWAGIAADEKKRADDAEAEIARLRARLEDRVHDC